MTEKKLLGLIGYPLSHSFSKGYFAEKFDKEGINNVFYDSFSIDAITKLPELIKNNSNLFGLNVTIPYKQQVIEYLDELDETATEVGAVNTIKIKREGQNLHLTGYNTDVYGFENSLKPMLNESHTHALILGTGGASKAIKYVLKKLGIEYISASIEELQENEIAYNDIDVEIIKKYTIIINATPLGTYPKNDTYPPIPYEFITENHVLFDLVYNPAETCFLKFGKDKGANIKNGLEMLHLQAEGSWKIFNM